MKTYLFSNPLPNLFIASDSEKNARIAYKMLSEDKYPDEAEAVIIDNPEIIPDITFTVYEDMTGIKDSMQLDSGTEICFLKTEHGCALIEVKGFVTVDWCPEGISSGESCDRYRIPSEFPKELKELIASGADFWNDDRVYIDENNWFELFLHEDESVSDVVDIEGHTNEDLLSLMHECIEKEYEENKKEA